MLANNRNILIHHINKARALAGPLGLGRIRWLKSLYYRFISSPAVVNGYFIYLHPYEVDTIFTRKILDGKLHEEFETECFKSFIKPGMTVLDIGANVGYYTLIAAGMVGDSGKVVAFEPEPGNFKLLSKSVRKNKFKNIILCGKGLSNESGTGHLYLCEDNLGDHRAFDSGDDRRRIDIELVTVDEHLERLGIDRKVDLIKMDIQGFEYLALQGMRQVIQASAPLHLMIEFWPSGLKKAGADPEHLFQLLIESGFNVYEMDEKKRQLVPVHVDELLKRLSGERFCNLLCSKN